MGIIVVGEGDGGVVRDGKFEGVGEMRGIVVSVDWEDDGELSEDVSEGVIEDV